MNNVVPGRPVLTREESRRIDRLAVEQLSIPSLLLMENAARGVADVIRALKPGRIIILCGPGNNGGDGLATARLLAADDIGSDVILVTGGKSLSADAQANLQMLTASGFEVHSGDDTAALFELLSQLNPRDVIIDALLGTGVRGAVRSPYAEIISRVNASAAATVAVDVPSGMDCDTGTADGACVAASHTVTFVGLKSGFLSEAAQQRTGRITVAHIGIPAVWVRSILK